MSIKRWKLGFKRCNCVKCEAAITFEQTEGNCGWVMWADHKDEVSRLKAEVERLRKAGDAMAEDLIGEFGSYNSVYDWNAAKKGGQS